MSQQVSKETGNYATGKKQAWRGPNQAAEQYLTSDVRWEDAAVHAQAKVNLETAGETTASAQSPRARWKRAIFYAQRLGDPDRMLEGAGYDEASDDMVRKNMEEQHWLEMIDSKHRYGSNLKFYFRIWKEDNTRDNFFYWLDFGGGKDLSLKECSREQLEKQCIIYLSSEQRLNYLVRIDEKGRLRWAKNNALVDTSTGKWKDAGDGKGIIPIDAPGEPKVRRRSFERATSSSSESSSASSIDMAAQHYGDREITGNALTRWFKENFTRQGWMLKLLRKTVKRNTWIYASDKQFNMFIGIKESGTFQHSSFLAGGVATSAGLITVKRGLIRKLSPLSGHYRTSIHHFRQFIRVLDERGVDMHKVEISRAEMALWGIEHLTKFQKAKSRAVQQGKIAIKDTVKDIGAIKDHDEPEGKKEDQGFDETRPKTEGS